MANIPQYLTSSEVNVFPSTRRIYNQDFSSKLMTELAISRLINDLMSTEGFVISSSPSENFEVNIHGYYFQIDDATDIIDLFSSDSTVSKIYASIVIENSSAYPELRVPAEISSGSLPEIYNPSNSYIPGQLVRYKTEQQLEYLQYQCIAETTGTWDSSKWVQLIDTFQGLHFTSDIPTLTDLIGTPTAGFELYTLLILEKVTQGSGFEWIIPDASKLWLDIAEIDGGVIE